MILYEPRNGIARIRLNRPEKRNALHPELIAQLAEAMRSSAADPATRVVLLSGAGADFCSGADLAVLRQTAGSGVLDNLNDARVMADLFIAMRRHPHPIVAAVQGRALAGGCGLATAADLVVASESAQFGYPEVNIGFVPAMVMAILHRSVSEKRAFELIASGEIVSAQIAFEMGLVNRVFSTQTFDIEVEAYASRLAAKPASAVTLAKQLLYHMDGMSFAAALESGVQMNAIARQTDDCKQGIARFLDRKTP